MLTFTLGSTAEEFIKKIGGTAFYNFLLKLGDSIGCEDQVSQMFEQLFSLGAAMDGSFLFEYCDDDILFVDEWALVKYMLGNIKRLRLFLTKKEFMKARSIMRKFGVFKFVKSRVLIPSMKEIGVYKATNRRILAPHLVDHVYHLTGYVRMRLHLTVVENKYWN
jgi:hypothetical protein